MHYDVTIIYIAKKMPLQIDHSKKISGSVELQVQIMPHIETAIVLSRNFLQPLR